MMKQLIYLLMWICLVTSCYEDKGNYIYTELEEIEISELNSEYSVVYMKDRLQIVPKISISNPDADLEYRWTFQKDAEEIATTVALDTFMNWSPNVYNLILRVKNKNTGYAVYKTIKVTVNTEFSIGWYVLKDNGSVADLDLYTDTILIPNVIQLVNGTPAEGKGEKISYISKHDVFDFEENKYTDKKVIFVLTDRDINGIDAVTAHRWRKFDDLFFEVPTVISPNCLMESALDAYLINDGKVRAMGLSSQTNGKFGTIKHVDGDYQSYNLSKYTYCDNFKYGAMVYDTVSCTFYTASSRQEYLTSLTDGSETEMSCRNTNKRLLYMGNRTLINGSHAYAVFQDKTDPKLKIMSKMKIIGASGFNISGLEITNDTLEVGTPEFNAQLYTMSFSEEVMYFAANQQIYSKNFAGDGKNGVVSLEYTIPTGEKVTFIKSIYLNKMGYNYFVIGTEINNTYKIRFFEKRTAGHLNPNPVMTLPRENESGSGRASDVIYVHPKIGIWDYIPTY